METKNSLQKDSEYKKWFDKYHKETNEDGSPIYLYYINIIRALCGMKEIFLAAKTKSPYLEGMLESSVSPYIILDEKLPPKTAIFDVDNNVWAYIVFTSMDYGFNYLNESTESGYNAVTVTTMAKILNHIKSSSQVTRIVVNYLCDTQITLDERAVEIAFEILQEINEHNDNDYIKGRKYSDEASRLYFGTGVKKDKVTALKLYSKAANLLESAAKLGNTKAMYDLAILIRNGYGVEQDFEKAEKLFRESMTEDLDRRIAELEFYKRKSKK